jgi:hypothetical protein
MKYTFMLCIALLLTPTGPLWAEMSGGNRMPDEAGKPRLTFKGPVKVFILAGQSNMEGHAGVQTLDQLGKHPTHGYLLKKIKKDDGSFVVRDDVFVSYQKEDEKIKRPLSVGMGAWGADWFGPELMFGIEMGDYFNEPVLLIKTCWGGHSLYGNFRPPSAGKPAYESEYKSEEIGASYRKMVKEVRECLANLDSDFPQLKGLKHRNVRLRLVPGLERHVCGRKNQAAGV